MSTKSSPPPPRLLFLKHLSLAGWLAPLPREDSTERKQHSFPSRSRQRAAALSRDFPRRPSPPALPLHCPSPLLPAGCAPPFPLPSPLARSRRRPRRICLCLWLRGGGAARPCALSDVWPPSRRRRRRRRRLREPPPPPASSPRSAAAVAASRARLPRRALFLARPPAARSEGRRRRRLEGLLFSSLLFSRPRSSPSPPLRKGLRSRRARRCRT